MHASIRGQSGIKIFVHLNNAKIMLYFRRRDERIKRVAVVPPGRVISTLDVGNF